MKTIAFIIGFFISVSVFAQPKLGMVATYSINPASVTTSTIGAVYGNTFTVTCAFKNKGNAVFTGSVSILRSIFSGTFQSTAVIVTQTVTTLNQNDSLQISFTDSITPGNFRPGNGNTVVVWPVSPSANTIDSLRTTPIFVNDISGIHEFEKNVPVIYPNPVSQMLFIKPQQGVEYKEVKVYDMQMQLVMKIPFSENIDVSILPTGVYTVTISSNKNKEYATRFTKVD